jgi:pimeloyl-ACP methyl ester carboxylesterase
MEPVKLNYKEYGSGNHVLLILHGFLGSLDNWHSLATQWSTEGLHVYSLDMRNHGKSPHTAEHSIGLMADDVIAFLNEQNLTTVMVLGHSMGGKVAMYLALHHPEYLSKLIVADIAPKKYKSGAHDDVFKAILHVDLKGISTRKEAEEAMMPFLGDFSTRQFILKSLEREGNIFKWRFNIKTLIHQYENVIGDIDLGIPFMKDVLFLKGNQSLYIKSEDEAVIKRLFPKAILSEIDKAGHWLHAENPKAFTESILKFVND